MDIKGLPLLDIRRMCCRVAYSYGLYEYSEDIISETVLMILESKRQIIPDPYYIYPIIKNACSKIAKQHFWYNLSVDYEVSEDLTMLDLIGNEVDYEREALAKQLWNVLDTLPEPKRSIVKNYFMTNGEETAKMFGISRSRVNKIVQKAIKYVREQVGHEPEEIAKARKILEPYFKPRQVRVILDRTARTTKNVSHLRKQAVELLLKEAPSLLETEALRWLKYYVER